MKKFLKIVFIIFVSIILLVIGIVAYIGLKTYDTTNNTPATISESSITTEELLQNKLTEVLDNAETKDDINLYFTELEMNQLVYCITKDLEISGVDINGAYISYLDDNILSFELPAKVLFFPTCVHGQVRISFENQVLSLEIIRANVGSMDCKSSFLLKTFVWNSSMENTLENALSNVGIHCTINFKDFDVSISTQEINDAIQTLLKEDPNVSLYTFLCDFCLNNDDTISFVFGDNDVYGVSIHAGLLAYDETRDGEMQHSFNLASAKSSTQNLLSQGVTYKNISVVLNYYVSGYNSLTDEEKEIIDDLNLPDNTNGQKPSNAVTMLSLLKDQSLSLPNLFTHEIPIVSLTENQVDSILTSLKFVGLCFGFTDGEKVAAIMLEECNLYFDNNALSVNLIVNLNGKRIVAHIDSNVPETEVTSLEAEITTLRLGNKIIQDQYAKELLNYLEDVLASESWISANAETNTITLDFKEVLSEIPTFKLLLSQNHKFNTHCRKSTYGYIEIVLKPFS